MIAFKTEKIKKMIDKKIHHPYIEQHIEKPFIDLDKIAILLEIYNDLSIDEQQRNEHIISIMLVQVALDTHDLVTNESEDLSDDFKRQLFVLAGDYYSGLYYKTLAEIEENDLVQTLANAIKQINEAKMSLYQYEITTWAQLMVTLEIIEATLLTNVANMHKLSDIHAQYVCDRLLINRLYRECEAIKQHRFSYIQQYMERNLLNVTEPSVVYYIDREIEERQAQMTLLQNDSTFSFNQLNNILCDKKLLSAVEEG